ncbi:MAG: hypothetical protein KC466_14120, partial [Myxococcales bacterium]|nr:hypothetical protein [Myxococcales bacterium]
MSKKKNAPPTPALLKIKVTDEAVARLHELLARAVAEEDPTATLDAIRKLPPRLGPVLAHGFMRGDARTRAAIVRYFDNWNEEAMLDVFSYVLATESPDPRLRVALVELLVARGVEVPADEVEAVRAVRDVEALVDAFVEGRGDPAGEESLQILREVRALPGKLRDPLMRRLREEAGLRGVELLLASGDEALAEAAVEGAVAMASPEATALLRRLEDEAGSKSVRKMVKRALYRLKSRGVIADEAPERAPTVWSPPKVAEPVALASIVDGRGYSQVFLFRPMGMGEWASAQALISDESGLEQLGVFSGPRGAVMKFKRQVEESEDIPFVELPTGYVAGLVEDAHARTVAREADVPPAWSNWKSIRDAFGPRVDPVAELETSTLLDQPVFERDVRRLLDQDAFDSWFFDEDELADVVAKIRDLDDSGLVLGDGVKADRRGEIETESRAAKFTTEERARWSARLRRMAAFLNSKGFDDDARVALHQSKAILDTEADCPFAEYVYARSLARAQILEERKRAEEAKESVIVDPNEAVREAAGSPS